MISTYTASRRSLVAAISLVAVGAALLAFASGPEGRAAAAGPKDTSCAAATTPASELTVAELRKSARCLLNDERAVRGLSKLSRVSELQKPAQQHARAMAADDCLAHRCGDEPSLETRVRHGGYLRGAQAWQYAEETGCAVSAEAMVVNWIASNSHRLDILEPKYHELGVGVVGRRVKSRCDSGYATFAILLGWRQLAD